MNSVIYEWDKLIKQYSKPYKIQVDFQILVSVSGHD